MDLLGFALAVLLIELTPGPNMAWLAGLAATEGRRSGLTAVGGVALGLLANGVLAALGLTTLLTAVPALAQGLRLAGAAMMVGLAIEAWRGAARAASARSAASTARRAFATGALINLLNPKAYLFFVVVAPEFFNGQTPGIGPALIFALVSTAIATAIHIGIVLSGSHTQAWVADPARTKWVRRVFALIMLAVAASFLAIKPG